MATKKSGPRPMNATAAQSSIPVEEPAAIPEPAPASESAVPAEPARKAFTNSSSTVKTTLLLPALADHELDTLAREAGEALGRIAGGRGGRYPGRSDVLKALIHLAAEDQELRLRMINRVDFDLTGRRH